MLLRQLEKIVCSTADPAFAIDAIGTITAWNEAAAELFGRTSGAAVGRPCREVVRGTDECGDVCSASCTVRRSVQCQRPLRNFDLHVETAVGRKWCNISVLSVEVSRERNPHSIHILRPVDAGKRLEILVRDFLVQETSLPPEQASAIVAATRSPSRDARLTARELDVLRALAKGSSTSKIAALLHISGTTVNNHVQHILAKLDAHSRLEAIRRAERAGLI